METLESLTNQCLLWLKDEHQLTNPILVWSIGSFGIVAILYKLLQRRSKKKALKNNPGNPFRTDCRRAPPSDRSYPKDKKETIKNPLIASKLQDEDRIYDVICIGSGASALTAAAVLSKADKKVLVLEQHTKLGGCCHTFKEGRFEFDTGLHYVGGMYARNSTFQVMEQLTEGQIQWAPMDPAYDEAVIGAGPEDFKRFLIYKDSEIHKRALKSYFPDESEAVEKIYKLLKQGKSAEMCFGILKFAPEWFAKIFRATRFMKPMSLFNMYFEQSTKTVLDSITNNEYLKVCISYLWGDFGCVPSKSPLFITTAVNNHFIKVGGFYPKNGSSMIPYYLMKTIKKNGGNFYTKAAVERVLIRKNSAGKLQAHGVEVSVGKSGETVSFEAKSVISSAGLLSTFQRLIPREITEKVCPNASWLLQKGKPSCSYLCLFAGFSESSADLKLPARNIWAMTHPDFDSITKDWLEAEDPFEALEKCGMPLLFIGFPSAKDPNYDYNNKKGSTCTAITLCPYSWFEMWNKLPLGKRGDQYEALKEAFKVKMWEKVVQLFPQLEGKAEVCIVGSPVTSNHYLHTTMGEIYGLEHGMERFSEEFIFRCRPKTDVENLILTGQDITTCGVTSAIESGVLAASEVLGRDVTEDLSKLYKGILAAK